MRREKQRRWFDVAKALHERLHIRLGTAALLVRGVAILWLYLSAKEFPPRWLFTFGRQCCRVSGRLQLGIVRLQMWYLRRRISYLKGELTMGQTKEDFSMRCLIWSQIAMLMLMCPEVDAGKCDSLGNLSGRVMRYARTFDPTNKLQAEMAREAIDQVRVTFWRLSAATRSMIAAQLFHGIDVAPDDVAPDVGTFKEKIREMLRRETDQLQRVVKKCAKCEMGLSLVDHSVGCANRRDN